MNLITVLLHNNSLVVDLSVLAQQVILIVFLHQLLNLRPYGWLSRVHCRRFKFNREDHFGDEIYICSNLDALIRRDDM
jgi:hypothetical protein